jgi:hypothetical protein
MGKIKTIYVAGPYSKGDIEKNVREAFRYGHEMFDLGLMPFVPHSCHAMHQFRNRGYEEWMAWDFVWLEKCDALFRIPGESPGADREVARATELRIPVFFTLQDLKRYLRV